MVIFFPKISPPSYTPYSYKRLCTVGTPAFIKPIPSVFPRACSVVALCTSSPIKYMPILGGFVKQK